MQIATRIAALLTLATIAALPILAPAAENTLTDAEKADGWTLLFDGRTMNGWDDPRTKTPPGDAWTIEDGCLKSVRRPQIDEDLFTAQKYADFELDFDWKISPGGNSARAK